MVKQNFLQKNLLHAKAKSLDLKERKYFFVDYIQAFLERDMGIYIHGYRT